MRRLSKTYPVCRLAQKEGTHSAWINRLMQDWGHEVIVANHRKVRAIYANTRKSDRNDAHIRARIARLGPHLFYPIRNGKEQAQRDLRQVKLRDNLVRQRVAVIRPIRFTHKSMGFTIQTSNPAGLAKRCRVLLEEHGPTLLCMCEPSLRMVEEPTQGSEHQEAGRADRWALCHQISGHPLLASDCGVGPITVLSVVLTTEDPERFSCSRDVSDYLGARSRARPIRKFGQAYSDLHGGRCLSQAASGRLRQYIMGPFGVDCDLFRHGESLCQCGGKAAKKKAWRQWHESYPGC